MFIYLVLSLESLHRLVQSVPQQAGGQKGFYRIDCHGLSSVAAQPSLQTLQHIFEHSHVQGAITRGCQQLH